MAGPIYMSSYLSDTTLGIGDGTFQPQQSFPILQPSTLAVGDFNGDGKVDLVAGSYYQPEASVLLGRGDGTFQPKVDYGLPDQTASIVVADFNADGVPDLALGEEFLASPNSFIPSVIVLLNKGDGTFQSQKTYASDYGDSYLAVGDLDGDGVPDIASFMDKVPLTCCSIV